MRTKLLTSGIGWAIALLLALTRVLDAAHAVQIAAVVMALAFVWPTDTAVAAVLPPAPNHSHAGERAEVSHLSWSAIDIDGKVTSRVVSRVLSLASDNPSLEPLRRTIAETPHPTRGQVIGWLNEIDRDQWAPAGPNRPTSADRVVKNRSNTKGQR